MENNLPPDLIDPLDPNSVFDLIEPLAPTVDGIESPIEEVVEGE